MIQISGKPIGLKQIMAHLKLNTISQIKFNIAMLKLSFCGWSDAYILIKGIIAVAYTSDIAEAANNGHKKVIFKNCAPFTYCVSEINNTQIDNAKHLDVV